MIALRHHGVTCDGCGINDFLGKRHNCTICFDYDLCDNCKQQSVVTKQHKSFHPMIIIDSGERMPFSNNDRFRDSLLIPDEFDLSYRHRKRYSCSFCNQIGFSSHTLTEHMIEYHIESGVSMVCPICSTDPDGDPNFVQRDLFAHLESVHRNPPFRDSILGGYRKEPLGERSKSSNSSPLSNRKSTSSNISLERTTGTGIRNKRHEISFDQVISYSDREDLKNNRIEDAQKKLSKGEIKSLRRAQILRSIFIQEILLSTLFPTRKS